MPRQMPSRWRLVAHRRVHLDQRAERAHSRRPTASDDAASPRSSRRPCGLRGTRSPRPSRCAAHGCGRAPARAMRTSRSVQRSAAISSRQTGCEDGSPSTRSPSRSRSRNSSSEWKAARRRVFFRIDGDALVVLDQQVAGRRAHEHLDAGRARQPLQLGRHRWRSRACRRPRRRSRNACGWSPARTLSASASALVVSGLVLGISKTAVTPPSTAAREPVSRSSLCSSPGSRKCTWLSITPGRMCRPRQSTISPARRLRQVADRGDAPAASRRCRAGRRRHG